VKGGCEPDEPHESLRECYDSETLRLTGTNMSRKRHQNAPFWHAAIFVLFLFSEASGTDLFVSPRGSDGNPGTMQSPFRTPGRARDAVRSLKNAGGGLKEPVTVYLRGGTYYLKEPLVLIPDDGGTPGCPITYAAYRNERPVISGGQPLSDWKEETTGGRRQWKTTISSVVSEENLVYRTSDEGFHQHYGKENVVRNNIFAFGRGHQIARSRAEEHTSFAFERNIVYWSDGPMFGNRWAGGEIVIDNNLYWRTDAVPLMADLRVISDWRVQGFDLNSEFKNPGFVAPEKGDFRIPPSSPAHALGIRRVDVARTLDPAPLSAMEEADAFRNTPARRLLFNSDGSNVFMAYDTITAKKVRERVDAVAGTGVTTFLFCPNPGQNLAYPGKVAPMFHYDRPAESTATWHSWAQRMSNNLASLVRDSLDPVGLILNRAKLRGMEGFLTFRMNELHDVDKPASPLLSPFWRNHPEYRVGGYQGWGAYALNYAVPEVREYFFAILEELCSRYNLDGLELDFMRFPYYFPHEAGRMAEYADIMTGFVRRVRKMTEAKGETRGRRILLSARIPSSLKGCAYVGLDPAAWTREGLMDFLTVAPFLSTESDIPVQEFKRVCGSVPVYAGLEYTMGARMMVREETRAASSLLLAAGADGIYLFNYFIAWDEGGQPDFGVLPELLSLDSLTGKDKLYTLCAAKYPVPDVSLPAQLPVVLKRGEKIRLSIPVCEPRRPRSVVVRAESDAPVLAREVQILFNGTPLPEGRTPVNPQVFVHRIPHKLTPVEAAVEYVIDPALLRPVNVIELTSTRDLRLEWLYLGVKHDKKGR